MSTVSFHNYPKDKTWLCNYRHDNFVIQRSTEVCSWHVSEISDLLLEGSPGTATPCGTEIEQQMRKKRPWSNI